MPYIIGAPSYTIYDPMCPPVNPSSLNDEFTTNYSGSSPTGWTAVGASNPTCSIDLGRLVLSGPALGATFHMNGIEKELPAGSFTVVTKMTMATAQSFSMGGLYLRNSTTNKRWMFGMLQSSGNPGNKNICVMKYSAYTSRDSTNEFGLYDQTAFFRISYNGTNLRCEYCTDGMSWEFFFEEAISSHFSSNLPDRVGLSIDAYNSVGVGKACYDFFRYFPTAFSDIGRTISKG